MKRSLSRQLAGILVLLLLALALVGSMFDFYANSQKLVKNDIYETLGESARQHLSLFKTALDAQLNSLTTLVYYTQQHGAEQSEAVRVAMDRFRVQYNFHSVEMAAADGSLVTAGGKALNVSGREYFKLAMEGETSIEYVSSALGSGLQLFVFSAPVYGPEGKVAAVMSAYYESDEFAKLLYSEIFGGRSYSYLTDGTGSIIVSPNHESALLSVGNLPKLLENAQLEDSVTAESLGDDIRHGVSRTFSFTLEGETRYVTMLPTGINHWVMFSVTTDEVLDARTDAYSRLVTLLSGKLMAIFGALVILVLVRARRDRRAISLSEEEYRIAAKHSDKTIMRYDNRSKRLQYASGSGTEGPRRLNNIENMPDSAIESGSVATESQPAYTAFFNAIRRGEASGSAVLRLQTTAGDFAWFHADFTRIGGEGDKAEGAIISMYDITEQREKEIAYEMWRQRVSTLPDDSFKLYECNLSRDITEREEGGFMHWLSEDPPDHFNERTRMAAATFVHPDDKDEYMAFLDRERLLSQYYQGNLEVASDFRMRDSSDNYRWIQVSVQMVPYPDSGEIRAFLLYRDINSRKVAELELIERSETDLLTRTLNRAAFIGRVEKLLAESGQDARHAFLYLDVDLFKKVNDTLGHAVGDSTLVELSATLRSQLRQGDLLGRLGGDEFMICLKNIPYEAVINKRAREICELARRRLSDDITATISVGVSVFPRDGATFPELYAKADAALYSTKDSGGDGFTFYRKDITRRVEAAPTPIDPPDEQNGDSDVKPARTMLIADDSDINRAVLSAIFKDEFSVLQAADGAQALRLMRKYGASISVLLLDIYMPNVNGMEVLQKMREEPDIAGIPVIVVSGATEADTALEAIGMGASDYVSKPVEPKLVRLRVASAIAKAENDRLRAQNSYLLLQKEDEARYRHILRSTGTAITEYDRLNRVFSYDPMMSRILAGVYDGRPLWDILQNDGVASPEDVEAIRAATDGWDRAGASDSRALELSMLSADGERRWFRLSVRPLDQGASGRLLLTFNDVNEDHIKNQRLRHMAEHDSLTGLLNRSAFMEKTAELLHCCASGEYVITHSDIDRFKVINELFGHGEGDRLLRFVGKTLSDFVGKDGVCCRLSADIFAICMRRSDGLQERLSAHMEKALSEYGLPFETVMSFGAYIIDDVTLPVDALLDRAAMAQKTVKGNYLQRCALYDDKLRVTMLEEQEVIGSAEAALEGRQFSVYLQPQYDHAAKKIIGAEALVRWMHPLKGVIPPGRFIPIFEKNGFISRLDFYVWDMTCAILRRWLDEGRAPLPVSVNISRMDIYNPALCDILCGLAEKYRLSTRLLKLEITESAYVENAAQLIETARELQRRGFIIEMDDFGSGYSSLNTLKDVPVDVLKMDMRFLSAGTSDPRADSILQSVIDMARGIGLEVIAEGVETAAQADHLLELGCRIVQGYYYARPMPVEDFQRLLDATADKRS